VRIDPETVIGPGAILEDFVVIERGVEVSESWIGPETFVGALVQVRDSLAWGSTLINWRTASCISVPDVFLLSALRNKPGARPEPKKLVGRLQANLMAWPAQMLSSMRGKSRG
jgi:NDP-sugar pyrophosphorylase family protein